MYQVVGRNIDFQDLETYLMSILPFVLWSTNFELRTPEFEKNDNNFEISKWNGWTTLNMCFVIFNKLNMWLTFAKEMGSSKLVFINIFAD